jgi:mono/diheme cytochrome c family protein
MKRGLLLASTLVLFGCGTYSRHPQIELIADMDHQPKYKPQTAAGQRPLPGTVAQGQLKADIVFSTGLENGMYTGKSPLPVTAELLARGQERFNIYCAPCHDQTGSGRGIVALRGNWLPTNLVDARARGMTDGEIFQVISNGRRSMPAYRYQVLERDRWAIVAYMRALERATAGTLDDVPPELRSELR